MRLARFAGAVTGAVAVGLIAATLSFAPASADALQDKQRQAASLANRIDQLQQSAEALTEDYNQAVLDLQTADREVGDAQARLTRQEAGLSGLQSQMAQFALKSYVHADQTTGVATLLDAATLSGEGAGRSGYAAVALGTNLDISDELKAALEDTGRQRAALGVVQQRQKLLTETVAKRQVAVDKASEQAQAALQDVKGDLVGLVAAEEQRKAEAEASRQLAEISRQRDAAAAAATRPAAAGRTVAAGGGAAAAGKPAAPATPRFSGSVPAPSPGAAGAVAAAMSQVGNRYVGYKASPETGFDCSGLTMWAWGQAGVRMPHQSRSQFASFPQVPLDQLQPGDLVFMGSPIHHVGIYIGGGSMVHASDPRRGVLVSPIHNLVGAVRPG